MKCKYNKHILCDRVKLVCNGCSIEQAIMDERERVKDILDKAEAEMMNLQHTGMMSLDDAADKIPEIQKHI